MESYAPAIRQPMRLTVHGSGLQICTVESYDVVGVTRDNWLHLRSSCWSVYNTDSQSHAWFLE